MSPVANESGPVLLLIVYLLLRADLSYSGYYYSLNREHAPSIIFMDEIDSIGSARMESGSGNGDSEVQRTMLELLNQLDGFEASNKIKVYSCVTCFL